MRPPSVNLDVVVKRQILNVSVMNRTLVILYMVSCFNDLGIMAHPKLTSHNSEVFSNQAYC
jgi:hypothetical protein